MDDADLTRRARGGAPRVPEGVAPVAHPPAHEVAAVVAGKDPSKAAPPSQPDPADVRPFEAGTILSLADDRENALMRAVAEVRAGGVIVMPTDTVYGIAANAFDRRATAGIFAIKRRPRSLPLPILVSRPRQAWALCAEVPPVAAELAAEFWPGPLTLVLPATDLDWDLGESRGTIAVRIPAHDDLITLLDRTGPLACTSANLTGEPTPDTVEGVRDKLGALVGIYLDGGPAPADAGSTIVDCTGPQVKVVREGPIGVVEVQAAAARASQIRPR